MGGNGRRLGLLQHQCLRVGFDLEQYLLLMINIWTFSRIVMFILNFIYVSGICR